MNYFELGYLLIILLFNLIFPGVFVFVLNLADRKIIAPLVPVISMTLNSFIYWIFYINGIYTPLAVGCVWAVYIITTFILIIKINTASKTVSTGKNTEDEKRYSLIGNIEMLCILYFLVYWSMKALATPFLEWDAAVLWNKWAMQMGTSNYVGNEHFYGTYPQLWPSFCSVIYKMNYFDQSWYLNWGQYVSHFWHALVAVNIAWLLYAYMRFNNTAVWFPVVILFLNTGYVQWMISGYSDNLPGIFILAFFYLLQVYSRKKSYFESSEIRYLGLIFILSLTSVGASFSKQPGIFMALFFVFWLVNELIRRKKNLLKMILIASIPCFLLSTFHLRQWLRYRSTIEWMVTQQNEGTAAQNIIHGNFFMDLKSDFSMMINYFLPVTKLSGDITEDSSVGHLFSAIIILSLLYGLVKKDLRAMTGFFILFCLVWIKVAHYVMSRHILMVLPLLAILIARLLQAVFGIGSRAVYNLAMVKMFLLFLFFLNNRTIFIRPWHWPVPWQTFRSDKDRRFELAFRTEAEALKIIKSSKYYVKGSKVFAHTRAFFPFHPDGQYVNKMPQNIVCVNQIHPFYQVSQLA